MNKLLIFFFFNVWKIGVYNMILMCCCLNEWNMLVVYMYIYIFFWFICIIYIVLILLYKLNKRNVCVCINYI